MQCKVPDLRRAQAQRHGKTIAHIARTRRHFGHIHRQYQMPVARLRRTVGQRQRCLGAACHVELKPGLARAQAVQGLQIGGRGGGHAQRHASLACGARQHGVGTGPG